MPKAMFIEIEAKPGSQDEIAGFLRDAVDAAEQEPATRDWYALRFDDQHFGLFDTFDGHLGRLKHIAGEIGRGLVVRSFTSLSGLPDMSSSEIVAAKLPNGTAQAKLALYVPIETRLGQGRDFGELLVAAKQLADAEPGTIAWYALRIGPNHYAIIDFFADEEARQAHLNGPIAASLKEQVGRYLDVMPEIRRAEVLASKQSGWESVASAAKQMHPEQPVRIGPEAV